jgi:hypothetical protein
VSTLVGFKYDASDPNWKPDVKFYRDRSGKAQRAR